MPQDIVITPNRGSTTSGAQIAFTGYSGATSIYLKVLPDSSLSFEGSAGQLFSITDNLSSGTIFSVNDITGIPSFDVNANGLVRLAPYAGFTAVGGTYASGELHVFTSSPSVVGQIIQTTSGQTANSLEIRNTSGFVGGFGPDGTLYTSYRTGNLGTVTNINGSASSSGSQLVVIGYSASSTGTTNNGVAVGWNSNVQANGTVAVGAGASATGLYSLALGLSSTAAGTASLALGFGASAPFSRSVAIGRSASALAAGDFVYGDDVNDKKFVIQRGTNTGTYRYQASWAAFWIDSTDATHAARATFNTYYATTAQEAIRIDSASDLARVGIGGAASGRLCVYTGVAGNKGIVVQGFTSQSANLQEWQNSASTNLAYMNASGAIIANYGGFGGAIPSGTFKLDVTGLANIGGTTFDGNGGVSFPSTSAGGYNTSVTVNNTTKGYGVYVSKNQGGDVDSSISAFYATVTNTYANNPACYIGVSNSPGCKIFIARGSSTQTANLSEWQNSAGTVIASINASGAFNGLLASGVVTSGEIGNAAVVSGNIASGAVGAYHFNATGLASGKTLSTDGTGVLSWATGGGGGPTISDDTSTNATRYVNFAAATTGTLSTIYTSSTKLTFNPSTGDFTAGGNITANSDIKIKKDIKTIENALEKVKSLRGVSFTRIGTDIKNVGVIAQEVEAVVPELVRESDGLKSVAYGNITALLIEAIKEQNKKIEELEAKLCQLTSSQS